MRSIESRPCNLQAGLLLLLLLGFPVLAGAAAYEYDTANRLTKVVYENGYTIAYQLDAAGNIVERTIGVVPLALAVGILQNPYLTKFLDIDLVADRALDPAAIRLEVAGERVPVQLLDATANLWKGDYELHGAGGVIEVEVCGTGFVGGEECVHTSFAAGFLTAAAGGTLRSADTRMAVGFGSGALARDGYVLILPVGTAVAHNGVSQQVGMLEANQTALSGDALRTYRVSPPGALAGEVTVEFSYVDLGLPEDTRPDAFSIELLGEGPLPSVVDPGERKVYATTTKLGDFTLNLGPSGTSRLANPRFLHVAQNAPNPFNPTTTIRFAVETRQHVIVTVFDVRGRRLANLFDAIANPGFTHVLWNGRDGHGFTVPSGVYFVRVRSERTAASIRMVLVR
jgi:YD repeat-containing protein